MKPTEKKILSKYSGTLFTAVLPTRIDGINPTQAVHFVKHNNISFVTIACNAKHKETLLGERFETLFKDKSFQKQTEFRVSELGDRMATIPDGKFVRRNQESGHSHLAEVVPGCYLNPIYLRSVVASLTELNAETVTLYRSLTVTLWEAGKYRFGLAEVLFQPNGITEAIQL